jgi:hypothetical protein
MSTDLKLDLPQKISEEDVEAYVKGRGVPVLSTVPPTVVPPSPSIKMGLEVPEYLPGDLRTIALQQNCTVRYLVLDALHKAGCKIKPQDLTKDGRRVARK